MSINLNKSIYDSEVKSCFDDAKFVYDKLSLGGSSIEAYGHIIAVINLFFGKKISKEHFLDIIHDSADDGQIDATFVDNKDVYIFDIKKSNKFDDKDIKKFLDNVEKLFFKGDKKIAVHESLQKRIKKINKIKARKINIIIFRNSIDKAPELNDSKFKRYKAFGKINTVNINYLIDILTEDRISFPTLKIKESQVEFIDDGKPEKEELLLKLPVDIIIKHKEKGEKLGLDFFYKNIRGPQKNPSFKSEIKKTIENYKDKFHLLHNGITLISDRIICDNGYFIIENPQIINGAQTVGHLHDMHKEAKNVTIGVNIFCKILKSNQDFSQKVCETANTQKQVYVWELRAHDSLHIKLEKYISNNFEGAIYSRKNPTKGKKLIKIKLDQFIQSVYATVFEKPWVVKTSKKKLFIDPIDASSIYNKIKNFLESCDVVKINKIIKSTLDVDNFILSYKSKKIVGFLRDIRFYLIAFAYNKKTSGKDDLEKVANYLAAQSEKMKLKDPSLTNTKIFNQKDDLIWGKIVEKYKFK